MPFTADLPAQWAEWANWTALAISILIASMALRETVLARLAQYVLVGAGVGYAVVLAWHHVLRPRLWGPLWQGTLEEQFWVPLPGGAPFWLGWAPLVLGLLLWLAGLDLLRGGGDDRLGAVLRFLGALPGGILVGVGLGVALAGAFQGTLLPQLLRAGQLARPGIAPLELWLLGLLSLILTGGVLLAWVVRDETAQQVYGGGAGLVVRGWRRIGQRALWLAAGVLLARLLFSRITLLAARIQAVEGWIRQGLPGGGP